MQKFSNEMHHQAYLLLAHWCFWCRLSDTQGGNRSRTMIPWTGNWAIDIYLNLFRRIQKNPDDRLRKWVLNVHLWKPLLHVLSAHIILKIATSNSFRTLLMDFVNHHLITLERFAMVTPGAKLSGSVRLCKGFKDRLKERQPAKWGSRNTPWTPKSRIYGKLEQGS